MSAKPPALKDTKQSLGPRAQDYLETIASLCAVNDHAHVAEIAAARGVSMATVSEAVRRLASKGLVSHRSYGHVYLTPAGWKLAEQVLCRHTILFRFFHEVLALPEELSHKEACAIEHTISDEALVRLVQLMNWLQALQSPTDAQQEPTRSENQ